MTESRENILIIRHGAFGDIMQCNGALADLREFHNGARITLLTEPAFSALMSRCPYFDEIITDRRPPLTHIGEQLALRRTLRVSNFSRVYDLQNSDRTTLYRRLFLPELPWSIAPGRTPGDESDAPQRFAAQLQAAGVPVIRTLEPDASWMVEDVTSILAADNVKSPYIVLIPGCSARHPHKRWPHYPELASRLLSCGYDVVTVPGPDELDIAKSIPGHVLTGQSRYLDWFQLAGVLESAHYVVGNDTGPTHLASCLGRPGLALFGPHISPKRTGILRRKFEVITTTNLEQLSPEVVLAAVLERLKPAQS